MTTSADLQRLQRRLDDVLARARTAERQLDNVHKALRELDPKTLRSLGLPTVNFHDLIDARSALGQALRGVRTVQKIAEEFGAQR